MISTAVAIGQIRNRKSHGTRHMVHCANKRPSGAFRLLHLCASLHKRPSCVTTWKNARRHSQAQSNPRAEPGAKRPRSARQCRLAPPHHSKLNWTTVGAPCTHSHTAAHTHTIASLQPPPPITHPGTPRPLPDTAFAALHGEPPVTSAAHARAHKTELSFARPHQVVLSGGGGARRW